MIAKSQNVARAKWRFEIGDKVALRKGYRDGSLRGVVADRIIDDAGVEMISVDCAAPGWWQADWWVPLRAKAISQ